MVRLSFLLIAALIASVGAGLISTSEPTTSFLLRDGLLLLGAGLLIFWVATPASVLHPAADRPVRAWPWLLGLTLLAAFVRLWQVTALPPDCFGSQCSDDPTALGGAIFSLQQQLAALLTPVTTLDPRLGLRLSSALIGLLSVPISYWAVRPWLHPSAALLVAAWLVLDPWHLWASRSGTTWIIWPLLGFCSLWLTARLRIPTAQRLASFAPWAGLLILLLWGWAEAPWASQSQLASLGTHLRSLFVQPGADQLAFAFALPISAWLAAFACLGAGTVIRQHAAPQLARLAGWLLITTLLLTRLDLPNLLPQESLLIGLPFLLLCAGSAADLILRVAQQTWQILIPAPRLAWATLLLLVVSGGYGFTSLRTEWSALANTGQTPSLAAIAQALRAGQAPLAEADLTFFAPAAVINRPLAQRQLADLLARGRLHSLESSLSRLAVGGLQGELRLLAPNEEEAWLTVWLQLFPGGRLEPQFDPQSGELLFLQLTIPATELAGRQGITPALAAADGSQFILLSGPLQADWQDQLWMTPPLQATWQGTLLVPTSGDYQFRLAAPLLPTDQLLLTLDGQPVLDQTQAQAEQTQFLRQGIYRLALQYSTSERLTPLAIEWQPPGRAWEVIPATSLLTTAPPISGLLVTTYPSERWEGIPLEQAKTLTWATVGTWPQPYSVQWQGKLPATRAGEYLFSLHSSGASELRINGHLLLNVPAPTAEQTGPVAGAIYLANGWHDLELRYAPDSAQPQIMLQWQPAGGLVGSLPTLELAPVPPGAGLGQLPLPPPQLLLDPRLGSDQFAFSQLPEAWTIQARIPPQNLPPLPFAMQWQAGEGCGSDPRLLNQPHGVLIDHLRNRILVADTANQRVAMFDLGGELVDALTHEQFQEPFALHLGTDGVPLLLDAVAQQIFRLEADAGIIEPLSLASTFYRPRGFAIDGLGGVLMADTGGARVVQLDPAGVQLNQFGGQGSLLGRGQPVDALATGNNLWAISAEDGRLWHLNSGGSFTAIQPTNTLNGPHLAALPDGSFFVSDPGRGTVLYLDAAGQPRGQLVAAGSLSVPTGVDVMVLNEIAYLAVVDSSNCTLSWWQAPLFSLPR